MYCIYRITNLVNGKTYIGQHLYKETPYDSYMGSGKHLKAAQKKYGIENFEKEIICKNVQYKDTINDMEKFYIKKEHTLGKAEYNITDGGEGFTGHHSAETKVAMKGNKNNKGHKHSEETRRKISESMKGKNKGKPSPTKGKQLSVGTCRKMSEAKKGIYKEKHWKVVNGKRVWY